MQSLKETFNILDIVVGVSKYVGLYWYSLPSCSLWEREQSIFSFGDQNFNSEDTVLKIGKRDVIFSYPSPDFGKCKNLVFNKFRRRSIVSSIGRLDLEPNSMADEERTELLRIFFQENYERSLVIEEKSVSKFKLLVSCTSIILSIVTGLSYLLEFTNNINTTDDQQQSYVKLTSIVWVTLT